MRYEKENTRLATKKMESAKVQRCSNVATQWDTLAYGSFVIINNWVQTYRMLTIVDLILYSSLQSDVCGYFVLLISVQDVGSQHIRRTEPLGH